MTKIELGFKTLHVEIGMKGSKTFDPTKKNQTLHPSVFQRMEKARDLRNSKVNQLTKVLDNKANFEGSFLVNFRNNKLRDIDCNHRAEAIVSHLTRHPEDTIVTEIHLYENLTDEEENIKFEQANNITTQTTSDYLQLYEKQINIWKKINEAFELKRFPLSVGHKNRSKKVALHYVFHPYLTRGDLPYAGGFVGSPSNFINKMKEWNGRGSTLNSDGIDAFNTMREFFSEYKRLYGDYGTKNIYWKPSVMFPLFRIWFDNKQLPIDTLHKRLKKLNTGNGLQRS